MNATYKLFLVLLTIASLGVLGLQVPAINRAQAETHDQRISDDFAAIETKLSNKTSLPSDLSTVEIDGIPSERLADYAYTKNSQGYEICGTFKTDTLTGNETPQDTDEAGMTYQEYEALFQDYTKHKKGKHCFTVGTSSYDFDFSYPPSTSPIDAVRGSNQDEADETKKNDLTSIKYELELYYEENDEYPTLANMRSTSWITANLPYIDDLALAKLTSATTASGYLYTPKPTNCNSSTENCHSFTLSTKLSDGSTYSLKSNNN